MGDNHCSVSWALGIYYLYSGVLIDVLVGDLTLRAHILLELVVGISKLSWYGMWIHCSFAACPAEKSTTLLLPLMGGLSTPLQPPAQGQRKESGSAAVSTSASSCWASLRASFGFQSSFASNPKPSVCLCPCLPNWSSLSHYFPNQFYRSELAPVFNLVQWEPEPLQIARHCKWKGTTC